MPKSDEEIRKSLKAYVTALPDSERNPNVKEDVEKIIVHASRPLPSKPEKQPDSGSYSDTQTRSRKTEDTSGSHSDTSHPESA